MKTLKNVFLASVLLVTGFAAATQRGAHAQDSTKYNGTNAVYTKLHLAAKMGNVEQIGSLVKQGFDVNAQGSKKAKTPLMKAAIQGHLEAVQLLIARGADLNLKNAKGQTALDAVNSRLAEIKNGSFQKKMEAGLKGGKEAIAGLKAYEAALVATADYLNSLTK